jgi:hypothetical protein
MKECDKRKGLISSKLRVTYVTSNKVRYTVTKTFTTLHFTKLYSLRQSANLRSSPCRNDQKPEMLK